MPRRLTNLLLGGCTAALVATGLLGWLLAAPAAQPYLDLHRAFGVALVVLLGGWKAPIVWRSLRRRLRQPRGARTLVASTIAAFLLVACLALGLSWTPGLVTFRTFGGYSALSVHVLLAFALLPPLAWHVLGRRDAAPSATHLLSRRAALRLGGVAVGTLVAWPALDHLAAAVNVGRRFTGSQEAGSASADGFPMTQWLADPVPDLSADTWRLEVRGRVANPATLSVDNFARLPRTEQTAALDCTGGWWTEQRWSGVRLADLLDACRVDPSASEVRVISSTGHHAALPLDEARGALLATHVGGEPLSPGHGYPLRLVAPERRGVYWVKWVAAVEVA